jgi:hypothetical protein
MQPLIDSLSALKNKFADGPEIINKIGQQIQTCSPAEFARDFFSNFAMRSP